MYESSAPVPIVGCESPTTPMVGMVAVPTIRSRVGFPDPPDTTTVSPTCLWSCASVTFPSTTWLGALKACPDRTGGATLAFGLAPITGTGTPSSWSAAK